MTYPIQASLTSPIPPIQLEDASASPPSSHSSATRVTNIGKENISGFQHLLLNGIYEPKIWNIIKNFNPEGFLSVYHTLRPLGVVPVSSNGNDLGKLLLSTIENTEKKSLNSLMELNRVFKAVITDPNFTKIPVNLLGQILIAACKRGVTPIVQSLMKTGRFKDISSAHFGIALIQAAQNKHTNLAKHLIESYRFNYIGLISIIKALGYAVDNSDIELVKFFLCNDNLPQYELRPILGRAKLLLNQARMEPQTISLSNKKYSDIIEHLEQITAILEKRVAASSSY